MSSEELIIKLQTELNLTRIEVLLLLSNTLSEGILFTSSDLLHRLFNTQINRLSFRKLKAVLETLQKLGFLYFRN